MKRIRGGSGVGDALYVRLVADHLIKRGEEVVACTEHAEVFRGSAAIIEPFRRDRIDVVAHYTMGKQNPGTTQWQDVCQSAGIKEKLKLNWEPKNWELTSRLLSLAGPRPLVVVHGGRTPMGRTDGFGSELLPDKKAFQQVLGNLQDCFLVRLGKGKAAYELKVDLDLTDETSIGDMFDIVQISEGVVGQCSFIAPVAECLGKPLLAVWASKGLSAREPYIKTITPEKILENLGSTSSFVLDDTSSETVKEPTRAFRAIF